MLVRKDYWGSKRTAALIHPSYSWKADLFCTMQVQRKKKKYLQDLIPVSLSQAFSQMGI